MSEPLAALLSAKAVRERCHELLNLADGEGLEHFRVDRSRMDDVASLVVATTRARYPDLKVPFHSRWRHFEVDGVSRWPEISDPIAFAGPQEAGRVAFELAIVSVLLDAGAGPEWRYRDVRGQTWSRSKVSRWPASMPLRVAFLRAEARRSRMLMDFSPFDFKPSPRHSRCPITTHWLGSKGVLL